MSILLLSDGKTIYSTSISKLEGRGNNYESASNKAYLTAEKELNIRVENQLYREIVD